MELDFSQIAIKGRQSQGNIFTRYAIHKVQVKEKIGSTLGGIKVWFDWDVFRLNNDGRGELIGEFQSSDRLLVVNKNGEYYLSGIDPSTHFSDNILMIEKYKEDKVYSATYFDGEQGFFYVKRFTFEPTDRVQSFISNGNKSYLVELNDDTSPCLMVTFGGKNSGKDPEQIDVEEFIGVKSHKAKGKRISSLPIKTAKFVEPLQKEPVQEGEADLLPPEPTQQNEVPERGDSASQMTLEL
jgi:topoisomerase-4 subunit A